MRKIINSTYITLDGVIEGPHLWPSLGSRDPRWEQIQTDLLLSCDALLMGRRTYEGFAPVWPTRSGDPYSEHINTMPKYVVGSGFSHIAVQINDLDANWSSCARRASPSTSLSVQLATTARRPVSFVNSAHHAE